MAYNKFTKFTNGIFTGTHSECSTELNALLPINCPENWPDGPWTVYLPVAPPLSLETQRILRREVLKNERDERIYDDIDGFQVRTTVDRDRLKRTVEKWDQNVTTEQVSWILEDNSSRMVSKEDLVEVLDIFDQREMVTFYEYQVLLAELETTTDPDSVKWT